MDCEKLCKEYNLAPRKKPTPKLIRDIILRCFIEENRKTLKELEIYKDLSKEDFEKILNATVEATLKEKFELAGGSFNKPTKKHLLKVIELLAEDAKIIVQESKTIDKNLQKIQELIYQLED